jgi:hypothetical protein
MNHREEETVTGKIEPALLPSSTDTIQTKSFEQYVNKKNRALQLDSTRCVHWAETAHY